MSAKPFTLRPVATALALGLCGGMLFAWLHIPLPWMLGPMFLTGVAAVSGLAVADMPGGRQAGQLIVGCGLGLYFTPEVSRQLLAFGGYIALAAVLAILAGAIGAIALRRIARIAPATAYFASLPGGAAEMAVMAERAGARFDQVALCHSLRLLLVVTAIPIAVTLSGASGQSTYVALTQDFLPGRLATLTGLTAGAAMLLRRSGLPNPWILAPLFISLGLTLGGVTLSAIPGVLTVAAQVLIGCALGTRFHPGLRRESPRLLAGALCGAGCSLLVLVAVGTAIARLTGASIPAMILATAPGGIAEMCLTAKVLRLGVPLVTAFQVTRLAVVLILGLPMWNLAQRLAARLRKK